MKKLYKISKHSKRIMSILMIIFQMRMAGCISNLSNSNSVKSYHKIVASFADFLSEEGIDDPQYIYEYYNYALWNGYFSKNHDMGYTLDRQIYIDNAGMSIMSSNGVCLNYSDMLSLIFKEMGFNSFVINCHVDSDNVTNENIRTNTNIVRNIFDDDNTENVSFISRIQNSAFFNKISEAISKITGNHAITCVEVDGELYFFDPTNLIYLDKTGVNDVSIINGTGKFDIKYFASLLFDNVNLFKIIGYENAPLYHEDVLEKELLDINVDGLEQFYLSQIEDILTVVENNSKSNSIISLAIYLVIAKISILLMMKLLDEAVNNIEKNDVMHFFPKLKSYFDEKNIKTELEVIKNYELIEKELGIKNNIVKDLIDKAIEILGILIYDKRLQPRLLMKCLNNLGYDTNINYANKYSSGHNFLKRRVPLITYSNGDDDYIYDYESEELLYCDNGVFKSLDDKYIYRLEINDKDYCDIEKDVILSRMNDANVELTNEGIKNIRKSKVLRK